MDPRNQLSHFLSVLLLSFLLAGLSGCGVFSSEKEWTGKVFALMSVGGLMSGNFEYTLVLEVSKEEQYILQVEQGAHIEGIEHTDTGIVWDLGKQYRITGKLDEDENSLKEVGGPAGSKGIIIASEIKLLDGE